MLLQVSIFGCIFIGVNRRNCWEALVLSEALFNQWFHSPFGIFLTLGFCALAINNKYGLVEDNKTLIDLLPTLLWVLISLILLGNNYLFGNEFPHVDLN